jgi:cyclophilin family peptidyl-prolyl cis-trans isomerase
MKKLTFLFLALSLAFVSCQNKYPDLEKGVYAEFVTNKGTFVAKLYDEQTPLTVTNFVSLAEGSNDMVDSIYKGKPFFDGLIFHRIIKDFMIQGGDPNGDGTGNPGYRFPDEIVDSLRFTKKGLLAMANSGPGTNGSQFFITLKETPWLDGRHTIFGEIVLGQEIIDSLGVIPTTKPGDKPIDSVFIKKVSILNTSNSKLPSFNEEMAKLEVAKKEEAERKAKIGLEVAVGFNELRANAETLVSGVQVVFTNKGDGEKPAEGSQILMNYAGYLANGTLFDSNIREVEEKFGMLNADKVTSNGYVPAPAEYGANARLIPGFREALLMMKVGDKATVYIPSQFAWGVSGAGDLIPPNSDVIFEIELVEIIK